MNGLYRPILPARTEAPATQAGAPVNGAPRSPHPRQAVRNDGRTAFEALPDTDWTGYATVYDLIAAHNPAYQDLVRRFRDIAGTWSPVPGSRLVDIGAGSGNFSLALAELYPDCTVIHLDGNAEMNAIAAGKAAARRLTNIEIRTADIDAFHLEPGSVAGVTAVHALYAFPDPRGVVRRLSEWLTPGGHVLACDPGRVLDTGEWARYIFGATVRRHGLVRAVRLYVRALAGLRQNRHIAQRQSAGSYWLHTLDEFRGVFGDAGLEVTTAIVTYRGCSDLVVARKPLPAAATHDAWLGELEPWARAVAPTPI